jgi:hypothetical protein
MLVSPIFITTRWLSAGVLLDVAAAEEAEEVAELAADDCAMQETLNSSTTRHNGTNN